MSGTELLVAFIGMILLIGLVRIAVSDAEREISNLKKRLDKLERQREEALREHKQ